MSIQNTLAETIKNAMRNKDKALVSALRLIKAEIQRFEVDSKETADDNKVTDIMTKMVKQRRDAAKQYLDADRPALAEQEQYEISVIEQFLPEPLSDEEVNTIIEQCIADVQPQGMKDMGKLMGALKEPLQGRADMGKVSQLIRQKLNS